ncbi:MAG: Uma2 family endonuclease [Deltaproteobacteria bacterium]|nr:Uma2 family endonuclease [Deltaproteobacteria bacterium]
MSAPVLENQPLRRLTRAEYDAMIEAGVFREDERIELVFGQLVAMSPIDPDHVESVATIDTILQLALAGRARVICGGSMAASADSEPEPDIYVTAFKRYWGELPSRAFLVVEVARSSLAYDRNEKALLYGISDVDEYWIVDHIHGVVEVRRDRHEGHWRSIQTYRRGDSIALLAFPDVVVSVTEILPPAITG